MRLSTCLASVAATTAARGVSAVPASADTEVVSTSPQAGSTVADVPAGVTAAATAAPAVTAAAGGTDGGSRGLAIAAMVVALATAALVLLGRRRHG